MLDTNENKDYPTSAISNNQSPLNENQENSKDIKLPPPLPLLPKSMKVAEKPPESVVKGIIFK